MSITTFHKFPPWFNWTLALFAVALLVANVLLVVQNARLKRQLSQKPPAWRPPVGTVVPAIQGLALDGQRLRLDWGTDHRDTFLFVFSQHCAYCDLEWPTWESLTRSIRPELHRIAYVNTTAPLQPDYVKKWHLNNSTVLADLDPNSLSIINARMTPEVIQISPEGRIEGVWLGLVEGSDLEGLKRALAN
jgi:hypothetical protein